MPPKPDETAVAYEAWGEGYTYPLETYYAHFSSDERAREAAQALVDIYNSDELDLAKSEMRKPRPNRFFVVKATTTRERL